MVLSVVRPALAYGDIGAAPKQDETYPVAEGSGGQSKDTGFEAMVSPVASPVPAKRRARGRRAPD